MEFKWVRWREVLVFFLFMGGLLGAFNGITPFLYRALPNDYARMRLIVSTLKGENGKPDIVVFGNSRGMSGVDGYAMERELAGNPRVYNLTSTGQRLSESALYYSSLPTSTRAVIQCVDLDQLRVPIDLDTPNKVALRMYGYAMDEFTRELLPALAEPLGEPLFLRNYEARNCLFTGLTTFLRNRLDDDVAPGVTNTDLRYPNATLSDRNEVVYQRGVAERNAGDTFGSYRILPEWKRLIDRSALYFKERGIAYYLVLMPYNPDIKALRPDDKRAAARLFARTFNTVPVIDCVDLLESSDFYDAIHPNRKGAEKITARIIQALSRPV